MDTAPEGVERAYRNELPTGVLRVRSDGKRIYAKNFKADLVR